MHSKSLESTIQINVSRNCPGDLQEGGTCLADQRAIVSCTHYAIEIVYIVTAPKQTGLKTRPGRSDDGLTLISFAASLSTLTQYMYADIQRFGLHGLAYSTFTQITMISVAHSAHVQAHNTLCLDLGFLVRVEPERVVVLRLLCPVPSNSATSPLVPLAVSWDWLSRLSLCESLTISSTVSPR